MTIENGDMVLVEYIGRKKDGEIFDLTDEEKAKEEGIYAEEIDYSPIPVLVGSEYVIEGFEEALKEMEVGEEKEIEVPVEKAYGERDSDNVKTFPEREFKKQGVNVRPGEEIMVGDRRGKVVSKGSGRVRVDFNHPLSGEDLNYWLKVVKKVEDDEEKARNIFEYRVGHGSIEVEDGVATVDHSHEGHDHEMPEDLKENLREEILENTGLEEVRFE
ncbi:MAG: peptidylprolyl isomerase [Candidatus Nanohaloarchaea archaeon]